MLSDQVLVDGATSLVNLIIHALLIAASSHAVERLTVRGSNLPLLLQRAVVIVATGSLLVARHLIEVVLWAVTYDLVGAAPPGTDLFYSRSAIIRRSAMATSSRSNIGALSPP